jgi:5-methylcytosine-specific restriction endonuclease McrA
VSIVACPVCGVPAPPKKATGPAPTYCSVTCRRQANYAAAKASGAVRVYVRKPLTKSSCAECSAIFEAKREDAQFCSPRCNNRFYDRNNPMRCTTADCDRGVRGKGLCAMHWRRKARLEGRETNREWDESRKANYHKRRAQKLGTQVEDLRPIDIYERDIWLCGLCVKPVDPDSSYPNPMSASLDHIIPLSKGGTHTYENVQLAHLTCNLSKGAKLVA